MGDHHGNIRSILFTIGMSIAVAGFALSALGCGDSGDGSTVAGTAPTARPPATAPTATAPAPPKCNDIEGPKARSVSYQAPRQTVKRGEKLTAVVSTNCGSFSIALDAKRFPTTVNSFVFLARRGFYEGVPFDRAGAGKFIEGGNPPGDADGPGYSVNGEVPSSFIYRDRVVAMSQSGEAPPGHAGSQFFVVLAKPWLDFSRIYAPLGTVEDGFDVLDRISELGPSVQEPTNIGVLGPVGKLRRAVLIENISIEKG